MDYIEMNTKNFCAIYFTCSQKRHVELSELGNFYEFFSHRFYEKGKRINILFSSYYLSQVCYDYDNLFEMDEEQLSLKKNVSLNEIEEQLGWMNYDLLASSMEVAQSYFNKEKKQNINVLIQKNNKREAADGRTL